MEGTHYLRCIDVNINGNRKEQMTNKNEHVVISMEEIKDRLIARYSPEDIIEHLQPDIESLVEGLHEFLCMNLPKVLEMVDYEDDEDDL